MEAAGGGRHVCEEVGQVPSEEPCSLPGGTHFWGAEVTVSHPAPAVFPHNSLLEVEGAVGIRTEETEGQIARGLLPQDTPGRLHPHQENPQKMLPRPLRAEAHRSLEGDRSEPCVCFSGRYCPYCSLSCCWFLRMTKVGRIVPEGQ